MRVLGMISGTSHDGIDAAVVDLRADGGVLSGRLEHVAQTPYPAELRARIAAALPPASTTLREVCELDTLIGQAFAAAAADAVERAGAVDLVCSHGQTVFHWVESGRALGTLQLGEPAWIAEAAAAPVVSDVRARDIAVGGQGAPLVSVLDLLVLGRFPGVSAALNLGGISNATIRRPDADAVAFDIGPANALIDAAVVATGADPSGYDTDGRLAAGGHVDDALLHELLSEPYYALPVPRSTGKELFTPDYVSAALARTGRDAAALGIEDLVATLTELTVRTVVAELRRAEATTVVVSGGGWRNPVMMDGIRAGLPGARILPSDELGLPTDAKEAIAFALIGWLTAHGLPGAVPSCTGADRAVVLGSITPGPDGLPPRDVLARPPASLVMESA